MEKLDLPVEYFNAVRNVSVGPKIDSEALGADAHNLGELVGLGLRGISSCPMELDIVPDAVERRRDLKRRKPFLITSGACLLGRLAATGMYLAKGKSLGEQRTGELSERVLELEGLSNGIRKEQAREKEATSNAEPLRQAIHGRTFTLEMLNYLNNKLSGDRLWFTQIEPTSDGKPLKENAGGALWEGPDADPSRLMPENEVRTRSDLEAKAAQSGPPVIDGVRIYGLYREDQSVVYNLFTAIKDDEGSPFNLNDKELNELRRVIESDPNVWAQPFRFNFPLKEPIALPVLPDK